MDTGKLEIMTTSNEVFVDLCRICEHMIDSKTEIIGVEHAACSFTLPFKFVTESPPASAHSICTLGGCMPNLDFRYKIGPYQE